MVERAIRAGVPFAWAAADSVYGVGEVETTLRRAGNGYVLGVAADRPFSSWGKRPAVSGTAEEIAAALPASAYARLSAGEGTKGPRFYDWAYLELADLDGEAEGYAGSRGLWTRGLLIRRSLADRELAFFSTWCPKGTPAEVLVRVEGRRWAIEDAFETAKDRARARPQRDPQLAPPRLARHARLRHAGGGPPSGGRHRAAPKKRRGGAVPMVRWSVQEIRRVACRLAQRRIEPAFVIAWSAWRRCHQAAAREAHLRWTVQL
jgi:hypothetical protein